MGFLGDPVIAGAVLVYLICVTIVGLWVVAVRRPTPKPNMAVQLRKQAPCGVWIQVSSQSDTPLNTLSNQHIGLCYHCQHNIKLYADKKEPGA